MRLVVGVKHRIHLEIIYTRLICLTTTRYVLLMISNSKYPTKCGLRTARSPNENVACCWCQERGFYKILLWVKTGGWDTISGTEYRTRSTRRRGQARLRSPSPCRYRSYCPCLANDLQQAPPVCEVARSAAEQPGRPLAVPCVRTICGVDGAKPAGAAACG